MDLIIVVGGSISNGYLARGNGWADRLKRAVERVRPDDAMVYLAGIYANTSSDVLARLESEITHRLWPWGKDPTTRVFVIVQVGGNDTSQDSKGNHLISPERFETNLRSIAEVIEKLGAIPIFQSITPVNEHAAVSAIPDQRVSAVTSSRKKTNKAARLYNGVINRVFDDWEGAEIVDAWSAMGDDYATLLNDDGVHPTAGGHGRIYEDGYKPLFERYFGTKLD